jgi:hypothetical protein
VTGAPPGYVSRPPGRFVFEATRMKNWVLGAVVLGTCLVGAAAEAADGPRTLSSVFHAPPAEALGAAIGGVAAVNVAGWLRRRKDSEKDGD